ncbi:hypothetical protein ACHAWX_003317 [Stephanocyclus meneghinianus]
MITPSKQCPPLYPHVIQRLEKKGIIASSSSSTISPASFLGNDDNVTVGNAALAHFWVEAHALTCLRRASFGLPLETTFHDVMSSSLNEDDRDHREMALEHVKEILTGANHEWASIDRDGTVLNDSEDKRFFTMAVCIDNRTQSTRVSHWTTPQLQAVATLSSRHLSSNSATARGVSPDTEEEITTSTTKQSQTSSWLQYVTFPVKKISRGISYAIDSILGDEYTLPLNAEGALSQSSFREELDDGSSYSNTPITILNQIDEDDAAILSKRLAGISLNRRPLDNTDSIISIGAIVSSCRCLLSYTDQIFMHHADDQEEFFFLCDMNGNTDRIILHRHGLGKGSIGSLCRHCGNYYTANETTTVIDESDKILEHYVGIFLSSVSEDGVNLLAEALVKSHYALMDEETITLFPKGIPPNFTKCKSDHALFQIHTTRTSIQHRMQRLEREMETAKQHAVRAHRKGMTRSALVHMKRRKAATEELERCASLLSYLDAIEQTLQRVKDNVQLVHTKLTSVLAEVAVINFRWVWESLTRESEDGKKTILLNDAAITIEQLCATRTSLQLLMQRLEQVMETAKQNAVNAHRQGLKRSALLHLKRQKAATKALERLASLPSDLDASELCLQRVKYKVQLVHMNTVLNKAFHDIPTSVSPVVLETWIWRS